MPEMSMPRAATSVAMSTRNLPACAPGKRREREWEREREGRKEIDERKTEKDGLKASRGRNESATGQVSP